MEEEYIQQICEDIIRLKPDLVFTEKGVSGGLPQTPDQVDQVPLVSILCNILQCDTSSSALVYHPECDEEELFPATFITDPLVPCDLFLKRRTEAGKPSDVPVRLSLRSGSALPDEGKHHRHPPGEEDRQQPHRQVNCCYCARVVHLQPISWRHRGSSQQDTSLNCLSFSQGVRSSHRQSD